MEDLMTWRIRHRSPDAWHVLLNTSQCRSWREQ